MTCRRSIDGSGPLLLDLFCGGGGACAGYQMAGWAVTGVDHHPQPEYPGVFVQADALEYLRAHGHRFDAIHASPPCQGYSLYVSSSSSRWARTKGRDEPRLIAATRELLQRTGKPWVMENVIGSRWDIQASLLLCGSMFGLPITRHRLFESSVLMMSPHHPRCRGLAKRFAEQRGWDYRDMRVAGKGRRAGTARRWSEILGVTHSMSLNQLAQAIPPAYTEWIGRELRRRELQPKPTSECQEKS